MHHSAPPKQGGGSLHNDNVMSFENVLIYKAGWAVDPFIANEMNRNTEWYDFHKQDPVIQTASFFDPAIHWDIDWHGDPDDGKYTW